MRESGQHSYIITAARRDYLEEISAWGPWYWFKNNWFPATVALATIWWEHPRQESKSRESLLGHAAPVPKTTLSRGVGTTKLSSGVFAAIFHLSQRYLCHL